MELVTNVDRRMHFHREAAIMKLDSWIMYADFYMVSIRLDFVLEKGADVKRPKTFCYSLGNKQRIHICTLQTELHCFRSFVTSPRITQKQAVSSIFSPKMSS
jgi:hypothetical protein